MSQPFFFSWKAGFVVMPLVILAAAVVPRSAAQAQTRRTVPQIELRSLLTSGPELGVSVRDLTASDAKAAQLASPSGAYVTSVRADSPAAKAGLRVDDVIVTFDGERVRGATHLVRLVNETPAGQSVELVLQRAGRPVTVSATLAETDSAEALRPFMAPDFRADLLERFDFDRMTPGMRIDAGRLGVTAEAMSDQLRAYFGVENGVLVTSVGSSTPAASAGIRAGDVITSVGGSAVRTIADLRRGVAAGSGEIAIGVVRDKKSLTLNVRFPARERGERSPTI